MTDEQREVLFRAAEADYLIEEARLWWNVEDDAKMREQEDVFTLRALLLLGEFGNAELHAEVRAGARENKTDAGKLWDKALSRVIDEWHRT